MSATGRFRNDIIAAAKPVRDPAVPALAPAVPASWMDRMQRPRGRHAAITANINTWSNYKSWASRVRDSWQDDTVAKDVPPRKPR
jgi:hypothetical protein